MPRQAKPTPLTPALLRVFIFGVVFVSVLLAVAIFIPNPTTAQYTTFRIILALAAGGIAALIPGFLDIRIGRGAKFALRAGGALAVFVIVYFYSPAALVANPGKIITAGDCSPVTGNISGSNVSLNCSETGNKQP